MGEFLEFPDILQEVRGTLIPGRLKLQSDKVIFRNVKTGLVDTYSGGDIESINWLIRARGYCAKFTLNNGNIHRYDGFKEMDYAKLSSFMKKSYNKPLQKKDLSLKGWNWGIAEFQGNNLDFQVDNKTTFEVPLNCVSHSTVGKNEVTLEFHQNDEAPVALTELRFHIPSNADPEKDNVEEFYKNVISKADVIQATGDAVVTFTEVQCLTPRGRYDIKIYPTFLQLHGKTYDYKIPYTTILRLFLLPHRDGRQMFFVISLDPPIKQGQTRYHFIIALFYKDQESTVELALSDEVLADKYDGKLQKEMTGLEFEIVSRVMKTLVNRKITVPGSFMGQTGTHSVACSYKAATGFLYPLERGFMFVHKPPMHIRFDEVSNICFARGSGNTRSFDFEVETKLGTNYTFVGVEKDEYSKLYDFVSQKKLRVKNVEGKHGQVATYNDDDDSSEGDQDHYMERMKAEGKQRDAEDEEEDSTDDDYVAPSSGSEVAEEYDTDAASTSSSDNSGDEGAPGEKKKKEKKTTTIREPGYSKPRQPKGEGRKKSKKSKDPNAPKRPMSAFFLWMAENRESIKAEREDMSMADVGKRGGELWKELTDKSKYEDEAKKLKEQWDIDIAAYREKQKDNPPSPSSTPEKEPRRKKKSSGKKSPKVESPSKEYKGGTGASYKSKEFISASEGSEESDSDDTPLKKLKDKKQKEKKKRSKKPSESAATSSEEEAKPKRKRTRAHQEGSDSEVGELPLEEELLSSPEHSGRSGKESESSGSEED